MTKKHYHDTDLSTFDKVTFRFHVERVFADMKEKHGMRWTTLRGLEKVTMQAMLTFAAMNLKKLATWLWKSGLLFDKSPLFRSILARFYEKLPMRWFASGSMSSV